VKPQVLVEDRFPAIDPFSHRRQDRRHPGQIVVRPSPRGQIGGAEFEDLPQPEQVLERVGVDQLQMRDERVDHRSQVHLLDEESLPLARLDHADALQHAERLPYRRPADPELLLNLALGRKRVARPQPLPHDVLADRREGPFVEAEARFEWLHATPVGRSRRARPLGQGVKRCRTTSEGASGRLQLVY
jgi:hypothetical protein